MGYRFVKISTYYSAFLAQYYLRHTALETLSYDDQHRHLMAQGFAWADHMARALQPLGVDAYEIVENALPLQQAWAKEHGLEDLSPLDLLVAQIRHMSAEVVFVQDPLRFPRGWLQHLRSEVPNLKLVAGWLCAPHDDQALDVLRELDFVMTCTPGFLDQFRSQGLRAFHAYHAFAPRMLEQLVDLSPTIECELVFVGSLFAGQGFHDDRAMILSYLLANDVNVQIYGQLSEPSFLKNALKTGMLAMTEMVSGLDRLKVTSALVNRIQCWRDSVSLVRFPKTLKKRVHPPVFGREMLRVLQDAKLAFNSHIGVAGRYAGNVRLFEATGVGTCLLTDWKENLGDLFCEDREIVTYRSDQECVEKARWLLEHPEQARQIAAAGQARTLRDHTFERLAGQIDAHVRACMP